MASGSWTNVAHSSQSKDVATELPESRTARRGVEAGLRSEGSSQQNRSDLFSLLVVQSKTGDPAATRRLLEALAPQTWRICTRVMGADHPDVQDAMQESLVAIVKAVPSFRFESAFAHFATKVTLHVAFKAKRRAQSRTRHLVLLQQLPPDDGLPVVGDGDMAAERARALDDLICAMPAAQAEALQLRIVLGYSIEEAAAITGVSDNTFKTRLRLAKDRLRRQIARNDRARALFGRTVR